MRILTRYILGEILSHTLIGCALFTFILFMRELPTSLRWWCATAPRSADVMEVFLFTLPNTVQGHDSHGSAGGHSAGSEPPGGRQRNHRHARFGAGHRLFRARGSIVAIGGTLLGLGNSLYLAPRANQAILDMQQALETSQASYEIQPRVFYEDFQNSFSTCRMCARGRARPTGTKVFMADVTDPDNSADHNRGFGHRGERSTQELLMRLRDGARARDRGRTSRSNTNLDVSRPPICRWR